jgi:hypothetical protein
MHSTWIKLVYNYIATNMKFICCKNATYVEHWYKLHYNSYTCKYNQILCLQ